MSSLESRPPGLFVVHHIQSDLVGAVVPLAKETPTILGKADDTTIPHLFKATNAGRRQVRIEWGPQGPVLTSMRSRTPTLVNSRPVTDHTLVPGDVVGIGDTLMVYQDQTGGSHTSQVIPGVSQLAFKIRHRTSVLSSVEGPTIIQGPTGTEKLRIAQAVHVGSERPGSFVAVDCSQISPTQMRTRLFENAATPAHLSAPLLETAKGGALFMDNADNLEPDLVNDLIEKATDVRLSFGLLQLGEFWDGYDGLFLPPLRKRREDIPHWIALFCREFNCMKARWDTDLAWRWMGYGWPGNVDELHRIIARMCQESGDSQEWRLNPSLSQRLFPIFIDEAAPQIVEGLTPEQVLHHLRAHGGRIHRAAIDLGVEPGQLIEQLTSWNLDPASFK